jgi:ABC-type siderophore export system fused ATPase/permease subunit
MSAKQKDKVQLSKKNTNLLQVMHSFEANFKKIILFAIFMVFFLINHSFSDHLTVKVTGFKMVVVLFMFGAMIESSTLKINLRLYS